MSISVSKVLKCYSKTLLVFSINMSCPSPASSSGVMSPGLLSPHPLPAPQTPTPSPGAPHVRQNHVSSANLYGVNIVCLWIDGKERLCLAQISNTLLKDYSYNEIHNRRVALGITCVQCTPVQLEILRRAGAMPVSSRRCGMITKREAERLVKSFLEEMAPPKLPDDFAFDVSHDCGWGCRGSFIPSRYNSSRAKCVKCYYCNMYFSPNKFIFHFHRMPDSKYQHPDAANFNSWRRHLVLTDPAPSDDMMHAWEDVKAMFNGGSRKRVMASSAHSFTKNQDQNHVKRAKTTTPVSTESHQVDHPQPQPKHSVMPSGFHRFPGPYPFPIFGAPKVTSKPFPILGQHFPGSEKLPPHMHPPRPPSQFPVPNTDAVYPSYEMIWAKHLGLSMYNENSCYPPRYLSETDHAKKEPTVSHQETPSPKKLTDTKFTIGHLSAFKPVSGVQLFKPYEDLESSRDYSEKDSESAVESDSENIDVDTVEDEASEQASEQDNTNKNQYSNHSDCPRNTVITCSDNQQTLLSSPTQNTSVVAEPNAESVKVLNEADAAQPDQSEVDAHQPQNEANACGPSDVISSNNKDSEDEHDDNDFKCDSNDNCMKNDNCRDRSIHEEDNSRQKEYESPTISEYQPTGSELEHHDPLLSLDEIHKGKYILFQLTLPAIYKV